MARNTLIAGLIAGIAGTAGAGPIINEVCTNPKQDDAEWEFIELYGCAGDSLDGFVVLVINSEGGTDEIDEAFHFPTTGGDYTFDEDGYFVIWNTSWDQGTYGTGNPLQHANNSEVYEVLPDTVTNNDANILLSGDRHEASFIELQTSGDTAGKLSNDGSITVVLLSGVSAMDLSDLEKDDPVPNDGMGNGDFPGTLEDEVAWSDSGGDEWTENECNEFDYTPGFNPGYAIRVDDESCTIDATIDLDAPNNEQYRSSYSNWYMGEIGSNGSGGEGDPLFGDDADSYGAGTYTAGSPSSFVPMTDVQDVEITPGWENHTFSSTKKQLTLSCRIAGDVNDDGAVDFYDIAEVLERGGDYRDVIELLSQMGR